MGTQADMGMMLSNVPFFSPEAGSKVGRLWAVGHVIQARRGLDFHFDFPCRGFHICAGGAEGPLNVRANTTVKVGRGGELPRTMLPKTTPEIPKRD